MLTYEDVKAAALAMAEREGLEPDQVVQTCEDCGRKGFEAGFCNYAVEGVERWFVHERRTNDRFRNLLGVYCSDCYAARDEDEAELAELAREFEADMLANAGPPNVEGVDWPRDGF